MKHITILFLLFFPYLAIATQYTNAPTSVTKDIRQQLSTMPIKSIQTTPINGLYEIQTGDQIFYTDKTGQYLINGHMFDTNTRADITAQRLAEINRINWSDLPLENAIVSGPENGLKMAVFTDPDCPYCKRLEQSLQNEHELRIYTFLFPLTQLHPDAYEKSKSIWCAKNQHQAMQDVMLKGKTLPKATCKTPIDANIQLADKLHVRGTPTIFAEDGRRYTGGDLKTWLKQGAK